MCFHVLQLWKKNEKGSSVIHLAVVLRGYGIYKVFNLPCVYHRLSFLPNVYYWGLQLPESHIYLVFFTRSTPLSQTNVYTQVSHFLTHHFSCKCQHKYQFYVEFYILKSNYVPKLQINQFLLLSSINHLPKVHENFIISWKSQARVQTWVFTWAYISITLQQPWT